MGDWDLFSIVDEEEAMQYLEAGKFLFGQLGQYSGRGDRFPEFAERRSGAGQSG